MARKKRHKKKRQRDDEGSPEPIAADRDDADGHASDDKDDTDKGERIRRLLNELARELVGDVGPMVMGRIEKYLTAFHEAKNRKKKRH
jgi:hypothetical protein